MSYELPPSEWDKRIANADGHLEELTWRSLRANGLFSRFSLEEREMIIGRAADLLAGYELAADYKIDPHEESQIGTQ